MSELPDEWHRVQLGAVCRPRQWPTIGQSELTEYGYPVFGANGYIGQYPEANHPEDTIIVTCRGATCGEISWVPGPSYITGNAMCLDEIRDSEIDERYLFHYLKWRGAFDFISGSAQPQIIRRDLEKLPVDQPPLKEQQCIAVVLDVWMEAIDIAEELSRLKIDRFAGAAQTLLANALAPTTPSGWRRQKLGQLFIERNERSAEEELLSITAGRGVIPRDEVDRKDTSAADKSRYKCIRIGDIGYNTMRMWQGVSALSRLDGIVSPAYTIAIPKEGVNAEFIAHLFKLPEMIHRFWRYSQGLVDDTLSLKFPNFSQIQIAVPSTGEQLRIAAVLSGFQDEVAAQEQMTDLLRRQKRGLMQKLLTGEWRVPESIDRLMPGGEVEAALAREGGG